MTRERGNVAIIGTGYVGLTLAVTLAEAGRSVCGVEADGTIVEKLRRGEPHFFEKGLSKLLAKHAGKGLTFSSSVPGADVYVLCVGTPVDARHALILDHIRSATRSVAARLVPGNLVILRSTVPMGTARGEVLPVLEQSSGLRAGKDFNFVFAPERTVEGHALRELRSLPQIIGGIDAASADKAKRFFLPFVREVLILRDLEHAEMLKMMDNTYRDVLFAYANQMALIGEKLGLDFHDIVSAANKDYPRNNVPQPSPGVGGPCLTKDPYILAQLCEKLNVPSELLAAGRKINEHMPRYLSEKVRDRLAREGKVLKACKIFILGFAFKGNPQTSDLRGSTTLDILEGLRTWTGRLSGFDPLVPDETIAKLGVSTVGSIEEGFQNADAVLLMHDSPFYRRLNVEKMLRQTHRPCVVLDSWRIWNRPGVRSMPGILYSGVGLY